jgi:hypothetical protein
MKKRLWIPVALCLLAGCASINYMGDSYPPTQHVDLFFSENDIQKEYKIIGRMEATADADEIIYSSEKFTETILKKAREKGADGIVIQDFGNVMTGMTESRNRTETTEERKRGTVRRENETVSHSIDEKRRVEALVIKYQEP